MALCDDCRDMKVARYTKGLQKYDKHVLMELHYATSYWPPAPPLHFSDVVKRALASFEWRLWSIYAQDSVIRAVKNSVPTNSNPRQIFKRVDLSRALVLATLGSRLRRSPSNNCKFCTLLSNIRIPPHKTATGSNEDILVAFRWFEESGYFWKGGIPSDVVIVGVIAKVDHWGIISNQWLEDFIQKAKTRGFGLCRLEDCQSDVPQLTPAPQPTINFDEISQTIQGCRHNHHQCQIRRTTAPESIEISLIDCHSRKLIQTRSLEPYVALSYVWGGISAGALDGATLPRTLEDAIRVTQALGLKYIWIDQFCVNQSDHAIKHEQIRTMGRVYEGAVVTLIAASGSDANAGLPGAPSHPIRARSPIIIDGCIVSEEEVPIDIEIQNSVWASRGWTFQEQFFSQRFLVFAAGQVSFECRQAKYSSRFGVSGVYTGESSNRNPPVWKSLWSRLHDRNHEHSSQTRDRYQDLVDEYWPRNLSLEEDGINAFAATLEHLEALWNAELGKASTTWKSRMTFTAGIPHLLVHTEDSLNSSMRMFAEGLAWYSELPSKRRHIFPSWCWAGWAPSKPQARQLRWRRGDKDEIPLIRNVLFRSRLDTEALAVSKHQEIAHERIPIAEYKFTSVPEAVILDAPAISPSAVAWLDGKAKPSLWACNARWHLADAGLLTRVDFLSKLKNREYCLIALRYKRRTFGWAGGYGDVVCLFVRRFDQYRHERIGLVYTDLYEKVTEEQWDRDVEPRTWELI